LTPYSSASSSLRQMAGCVRNLWLGYLIGKCAGILNLGLARSGSQATQAVQ
jgi:hypothetical protein